MKRIYRGIIILMLVALSSGCAILNPYEEEFSCRASEDGGGCFDARTAYEHAKSTQGDDNVPPAAPVLDADKIRGERTLNSPQSTDRAAYKKAIYTELKKIVEDDRTPMLAPPRILKVYFIPFEDKDGLLFMGGDVYIKVEDSKWILDNKLTSISDQ